MQVTAEQIPRYHQYWSEGNRAIASGDGPAWVVLGDSLGQGIGATLPDNGYGGQLRRMVEDGTGTPGPPIINLSRCGARIRDVLDAQLPRLHEIDPEPALVTLTVGNNDLLRTATDRKIVTALETLCARLPATAVVATLPEIGSVRARSINKKIRRMTDSSGFGCADVGAALDTWRGRQAADRFHPNDDGYAVWAEAFLAPVVGV